VEAAAMAGAVSLCNDDGGVALQVAIEKKFLLDL
jgi:hypothetical protein